MNKKYFVVVLAFIVLAVLGGVVGIAKAASGNKNTLDSLDPDLQAQITAREAAYSDLITQANEQIEELNDQVTTLQNGSSMVSGQKTITVQQAVDYAMQSLNETDYLLDVPELASYQDRPVFNVSFTNGQVYVDAFSGEIVFSSIPEKIDEQQALKIAADYLGITDISAGVVQKVVLEGNDFFTVTFGSYIIYIDSTGNITKVQVIQYTSPTTSSGSASSSNEREDDDHDYEHEDDDDDD